VWSFAERPEAEPGLIYLRNDSGVIFKVDPYHREETPYKKDNDHPDDI